MKRKSACWKVTCSLANVALILFAGKSIWLHSIYIAEHVNEIYDYLEAMLKAKQYLTHRDTGPNWSLIDPILMLPHTQPMNARRTRDEICAKTHRLFWIGIEPTNIQKFSQI